MAVGVDLSGKDVLVVGAGRSGVAAARFARDRGARVTLTDEKPLGSLGDPVRALLDETAGGDPVRGALGGFDRARFESADLVVVSPGVPLSSPAIVASQHAGVPVIGEIELAARCIDAPVVAVTGTNGKSTVTSLCGEMAKATGRPTFVGGNLGTPLVEAVGTEAATRKGLVVCEVSSFQLETCTSFHPRAAVLLNLTPDHLDRHGTMTAYADAKFRIAQNLGRGDVFVMNEDDAVVVEAYARNVGGWLPTLTYSTLGRPRHRFVQPSGDGVIEVDAGGHLEEGALVLRLPDGAGHVVEERYATDGVALVGRHNLGNALAALLAMRGVNLASPDEARAGLAAFRPLPHRMELVADKGGVRFYDDSKGTNVAAVVASIDGFPRPIVLIAGGRDKGGSYAPLREALGRNLVRGVVVIGEAADQIAAAAAGVAEVVHASSMDEAVSQARRLAREGDAVVLSPACSSFDMFKDYKDRGRAFRAAVEALG